MNHLVVVLPGIGGSVLARGSDSDLDDIVWDAGKGDIADLVARPARMSVAEWPELTPVGLTRSTKLLGFTIVAGYEGLLKTLAGLGTTDPGHPSRPVADADIVAVPYDFRRSIVTAAEHLDDVVSGRLAHLSPQERAGRVVVVAHSMGGLVARVWMALTAARGEERWRWCRALITLGTPHRGAPKALDWTVNGVRLLGVPLSRPTRLLQEWPSVAELLPRYPAIRDVRLPVGAAGSALYPHELPVAGLGKRARDAYDLHVEIERAWNDMPRGGPEMVACLGWSHPTPDAAFWDGERLTVRKEPPDWLGLTGREKDFGDGTVPAVSGLPAEFDNHVADPQRLPERHVPLASAAIIEQLLMGYLGIAPPRMVHGPGEPDRPPTIGLDLDDLHAASTPIPLSVAFREVDGDVRGQPVWARLRPAADSPSGPALPVDVRLEWDPADDVFRGNLPGQSPGLYEVRVTAREVPGAGDLSTGDTIAVVAGD